MEKRRKGIKRGSGGKRIPEHWDGANWLVAVPIEIAVPVSPSIHGAHIRANVSRRSIKWKWSGDIPPETDVLARFTLRQVNPCGDRRGIALENDSRGFWYEREGNKANDWAIVVACITTQRAVSIRIRPREIHGRMTLSFFAAIR